MVNKAYLYVTLPIFSVKNGTALAQATRHLHPEVEKRILVPVSYTHLTLPTICSV